MRVLVLLVPLLLAGCIETPAAPETASTDAAPAATTSPAPEVLDWNGHIGVSAVGGLMHARPSEDILWPVHQEGFILDVAERPSVMEVALEWTGPEGSEFMIMLHSHKAEGTNAYIEHITEMDAVNPKCLRVPAVDIVEGHWQVMIHQNGADGADYTLKVLTVEGAVAADDMERHGHRLEDGAFEVEEHEIEACSLYEAPPAE